MLQWGNGNKVFLSHTHVKLLANFASNPCAVVKVRSIRYNQYRTGIWWFLSNFDVRLGSLLVNKFPAIYSFLRAALKLFQRLILTVEFAKTFPDHLKKIEKLYNCRQLCFIFISTKRNQLGFLLFWLLHSKFCLICCLQPLPPINYYNKCRWSIFGGAIRIFKYSIDRRF